MTTSDQAIVDSESKDEDLDVCVYSIGTTTKETSSNSTEIPFELLNGEQLLESGKDIINGWIYLTNYRLFVLTQQSSFSSFVNCPLRLIESIESKENNCLLINCKDLRSYRFAFPIAERLNFWLKKLTEPTNSFNNPEEIFAFKTSPTATEQLFPTVEQDLLLRDYQRLELDQSPWRLTNINNDYKLCASYPEINVVPEEITDDDVLSASKFRYHRRFPSVVWRHKNGAVLVRTSQPEVGWLCWRSKEDEKMVQSIISACMKQKPDGLKPSENQSIRLIIIDARSYAAALANRAKGGGFEYPPYYTNCDVQFMNLPNIHAIRRSSQMLRTALMVSGQGETWLTQLEGSRWLHNLSALLQTASVVVDQIDKHARPVLIHCSDGWDRTPQIISLAQIMLDPYYRTIDGFKVLIEREWIGYGHKFADRCGHSIGLNDSNDRSPVFLQWLDCVYQLYHQDSIAFQFNEMLLLKLAQHTYTCLYGDFLCNNNSERKKHLVFERTQSIWRFIDTYRDSFLNYQYNDARTDVLRPSSGVRELVIWSHMYLHETTQTSTGVPLESPSKNIPAHLKSFDDLSFSMSNGLQHTTSDPNLNSSINLDSNVVYKGRSTQLLSNNTPCIPGRITRSLSSDNILNTFQLSNFHRISQPNVLFGSYRSSIRERTCLPLVAGSDNQMKEQNSLPDDSMTIARRLAFAVQRTPLNTHGVDSILRNLTTVKRHTQSMSSTGSSLSEGWSWTPNHLSTDPNQPQKSVQSVNINPTIRSIRKKIDKDGLTKISLLTMTRIREKEAERIRKKENLYEHVRVMQQFIDLIPPPDYHSNIQRIIAESQSSNIDVPDSLPSSSWQKIDGKELTLTRWVPDSSALHCRLCNFKFLRYSTSRKHHCRECGEVFCSLCSNFNKFVPAYSLDGEVRVCRTCFHRADEKKNNSKTNMMIESVRPSPSCPIPIPTSCHQANGGQSPSFTSAGGQKVKG